MKNPINHASLFTGFGGFDLAAEWMKWQNIFSCEINPFCNTILKYYWPNATHYENIKETDFTIYKGRIDILTGGFPCQPFSNAGKRKGTDDPRHLWPEMLRAIREIMPPYIVGENVSGLYTWNKGMVFEQVCLDLENEGYTVQPYCIPASGKNAPHRRYRWWFVAYRDNGNREKSRFQTRREKHMDWNVRKRTFTYSHVAKQKNYQGKNTRSQKILWRKKQRDVFKKSTGIRTTTHTNGERRRRIFHKGSKKRTQNRNVLFIQPHRLRDKFSPHSTKLRGNKNFRQRESRQFNQESQDYDWRNFPTQSPICSRNDGLSSYLDNITFSQWRKKSIEGFGNAIVPQVALEIFKAINHHIQITHDNERNQA